MLNSLATDRPDSGLTMKKCAVWGEASIGIRSDARPSFSRADANPSGSPLIRAPVLSAAYSRVREMAIWMTVAASGARIAMTSIPSMPPPSSSSLRWNPPKMAAHCAMLAIIMMTPARVAAIELIRMSRFWTWASSWASTPVSSRSDMMRRMPSVTATAACCGLRPVANAFAPSSGMTYSLGIGSRARVVRVCTMRWSWGASASPTSRAPYMRRTILSENQ